MASSLVNAAGALCKGRIVFIHEGGYSENYVSFCGCAVIEGKLYVVGGLNCNCSVLPKTHKTEH